MKTAAFWRWSIATLAMILVGAWETGSVSARPHPPTPGMVDVCAALESLDRVRELMSQYKHADARALAEKLISPFDAEHGSESVPTACLLDLLAESFWRGGRASDPGAKAIATRAVALKKHLFGETHLEVSVSLRHLGQITEESGDLEGAEPIYRSIISMRMNRLGPDDLQVASARNDLGNLYLIQSRYPEARRQYEIVLGIQQRAGASLDAARTQQNLGILLQTIGEFKEAKALYEQAIETRRKALGDVHLDVAWTRNALGELLRELGEFDESRRQHEEALAIREHLLPPDNEYIAWSLLNLANLFRETGDYDRARTYYERSRDIEERVHAGRHSHVAKVVHNLAWLHVLTGDRSRAVTLYKQALEIRRETLGATHPAVATTLSDIGALMFQMGDLKAAERRYLESMRIVKETLGEEDADFARDLTGLARVRAAQGRPGEAESSLKQALEIEIQAFGEAHGSVVETLLELAGLRARTGALVAARLDYVRAVELGERALGDAHPLVGRTLAGLSRVLARLGEPQGALEAAVRAEEIGRDHLLLTLRTLPERQALRYAEVRASGLDMILSIASEGAVTEAAAKGWDTLIRSRALVLEGMATRRRSVVEAGDASLEELAASLVLVSGRLAAWTLRGPTSSQTPDRYLALLEELSVEKESIERELAMRSESFQRHQAGGRTGLAEVTGSIPPETGLVAYASFRRSPVMTTPEPGITRKELPVPPDRAEGALAKRSYVAFVAAPGRPEPAVVPLGPSKRIDALVEVWLERAGRPPVKGSEARDEALARESGEAVRRAVWDPVASVLGDVRRVLVVPDGSLNLLSLHGLPSPKGGYLAESGPTIHYLSAEREIVPAGSSAHSGRGLLALGGPDFDKAKDPSLAMVRVGRGGAVGVSSTGTKRSSRSTLPECAGLRNVDFEKLPGAATEANEVANLWRESRDRSGGSKNSSGNDGEFPDVIELRGAAASEGAFKLHAPGRRVLHLATHGFFLGGDCTSLLAGSRGMGILSHDAVDAQLPDLAGENPLLLSGLVLAGANARGAAGTAEEDGFLTAEEIAAMNLSGVELAVLSACDTGLGEISAGEGVLGLRRAFAVAGVKTVIMSLWQVGDQPTREWMREMHAGRLTMGLDTTEAVRQAALRVLERRRRKDGHGHPYFWAAFVAAGNWD